MKLHVVLVRSEYSSNIGAAARALANMGGDRLILIDPQCEIDHEAKQRAAGAQDKLSEAKIYSSWNEFYAFEGEGTRIALTRREGQHRRVEPLAEKIKDVLGSLSPLYLIFGPEADGLKQDDLGFVNFICHLPVYGEFGSLNLAQAVLLALYIVQSAHPPAQMPAQTKGVPADALQPFYFPDGLIREWLTAMGFDIHARKASAYLTLRRLFLQNHPTRHELQVVEAILQQNIRKLKERELLGLAAEKLTDDGCDITS